jgi:hypothetical protein
MIAKHSPQHLPILSVGGSEMRHFMAGLAVLGVLAAGVTVPASARPLSLPPAEPSSAIQQAGWDGCGPRCREYRRDARERDWEHRRWAQHRRWEERQRWEDHRGWNEGRRYPAQPYDHQNRY